MDSKLKFPTSEDYQAIATNLKNKNDFVYALASISTHLAFVGAFVLLGASASYVGQNIVPTEETKQEYVLPQNDNKIDTNEAIMIASGTATFVFGSAAALLKLREKNNNEKIAAFEYAAKLKKEEEQNL